VKSTKTHIHRPLTRLSTGSFKAQRKAGQAGDWNFERAEFQSHAGASRSVRTLYAGLLVFAGMAAFSTFRQKLPLYVLRGLSEAGGKDRIYVVLSRKNGRIFNQFLNQLIN
jgi:hypothetical protein